MAKTLMKSKAQEVRDQVEALAQPGRLVAVVREYQTAKANGESILKRANALKDRLKSYVETAGEPDDKGNLWVSLGEYVEGGANALKGEKHTTTIADPDVAEDILSEEGLFEEAFDMMPVLNEDKVSALLWEGKITQAQYNQIFKKSTRYHFHLGEVVDE